VTTADGSATHEAVIAPGTFDIQRIDGLPADQVTPEDPVLLARLVAEGQRKAAGFASLADLDAFKSGFILPVEGARRSARFGGQRILNGEPKRPHFGVDLAAPVGTPVRAPAAGVVAFAETGLHFEGGLILIDHGQGLITAYLHLSKVLVSAGDSVRQGQLIAAVGKEGRATGPHLCWRMKWHGRNLDPSLMVGASAPRLQRENKPLISLDLSIQKRGRVLKHRALVSGYQGRRHPHVGGACEPALPLGGR
jgi:murein DD-endopeptidase MepM/ murein hydrolase activator NlpD